MSLVTLFALATGLGLMAVGGALVALRHAGARPGVARRLAGAREVRVGTIHDLDELPRRPLRVAGRIRCADPLRVDGDVRLVAYHRDVEVRTGTRWRGVERMRETRSFELWDHDGALALDPALAAEPLITIPSVWRGEVAELAEPHASAAARLAERYGSISGARAVTRTVNVTDRLFVLAQPRRRPDGRLVLEPPTGGYLLTTLPLDDAMRLLGGTHRRVTVASVVALAAGTVVAAIGVLGMALAALARA